MNNQTGPYKEAETIDEEDIKRITGVLYGGKPVFSVTESLSDAERIRDSCNGHCWYFVACIPDEALNCRLFRPVRH